MRKFITKLLFFMLLFTAAIAMQANPTCNAPRNPSAVLHSPQWFNIRVQWELPLPQASPLLVSGYNLYRNGVKINTSTIYPNYYLDLVASAGTYQYAITALWSDGCESRQIPFSVTITSGPCTAAVDLNVQESFDIASIPPVCWSSQSADNMPWKRTTWGFSPTCYPHSGAGMLCYECVSSEYAGKKGLIITPLFNTGNTEHTVSFWMYRSEIELAKIDKVNVYVSPNQDITGLSPIMTIHRSTTLTPVAASSGWYEYRATFSSSGMPTAYVIFEGVSNSGGNIYIDDITVGDLCQPIVNLQYTVANNSNITLSWNAPETNAAFQSYTIYKNGNVLASNVTALTYTDLGLAIGEYIYGVEAKYNNACGASERILTPEIFLTTQGSCNSPINLSSSMHVPNWYDVHLNWGVPSTQKSDPIALLYEGFDKNIPDTWINMDKDGDGHKWLQGGRADVITPFKGDGVAYSQSYINGGYVLTPDNWLIAPRIFVPAEANLQYYVVAQESAAPAEHYGVFISTTGTNYNDFTLLFEETLVKGDLKVQGQWFQRNLDLSAYIGQNIYIAFRHFNCTNQYFLDLDEVSVTLSNEFPLIGFNVYKNGVKMNKAIITGCEYAEYLGVDGVFNFGVTAVWGNYCESAPTTISVTMPLDPCIVFLPIQEDFEGSIFPPTCWQNITSASDNAPWKKVNDGKNPTCTPYSGNSMLQYNCYNFSNNKSALLITAPLKMNFDSYLLSFNMYRDVKYPGSRDRVNIYLSSTPDITGLEPIMTVNRNTTLEPVVSAEGWYEYFVELNTANIETGYVIFQGVSGYGNNIYFDNVKIVKKPCNTPENLSVTMSYSGSCEAAIAWNAPSGGTIFNIYRDNVKIASNVTETSYIDTDFAAGQHTWCVATVCGSEESERACATETCTIPTYTITASASVGGTITPTGTISVVYGNDRTFTFTSFTGYQLKEVLVDGTNVPEAVAAGNYTFENVTSNHTIVANFEKTPFVISATAEANGTISPAGDVTVFYGDNKTFNITANAGYSIHEILVDGVNNVSAVYSGSYTFTNVRAPHEISATFVTAAYNVTTTAGVGGTISPSGVIGANHGENKMFFIVPNAGYVIEQVLVDGSPNSEAMSGVYTFTNISASHTISATFEYSYSTIMATADEGGTIAPAGASQVSYDGSKFYTITPSAGYKIAQVLVDGAPNAAAVETGTYLFTNVTTSHSIHATFTHKSYDISASCNDGGTISPAGTTTLNYGGSQVYTITTATGYTLTQVLVDGVSIGTPTTYTFSNVIANHSIRAIFEIKKYDITATAGAGGAIFPTGITTVNHGSGKAYSFHANEGYKLKEVLVDGSNNAAAVTSGTYTFSNVTANHTIAANFEAIQFTVTSSIEGANGSITPTGEQKVNYGDEISFTITPNEGYLIDKVLVDGISRPGAVASGEFAFSGVMKDHTIAASFTLKTNINEGDITSLAVYPNPTTGELKIMNGELRMNTILVFDITGKLLMKRNNVDNTQTTIDISEFAQGIYFFNVDGKVVKVVKQ